MGKLIEPKSMDECVYFTNRVLDNNCYATAWVFRGKCTKCQKGMMGKPIGPDGKVKIRAKEYSCPSCHYTINKEEYEDTLTCNIKYKCPKCNFEGETQIPFKRKKVQGVDTLTIECEKCKNKIYITKKMKQIGEESYD